MCGVCLSSKKLWRWFAVVCFSCVLTVGCASWDHTPEEPPKEAEASWDAQFRRENSHGQKLGLDPRSREIESSLGVP
jgi:hypothetical protein